jgi:hypothetical protein
LNLATGEQQMTSRRKFLKQGTLGAVAAGFALGAGSEIRGASSELSDPSAKLDRAAFASQLRTTFLISGGGRKKTPLKLTEVVDLGAKETSTGRKEAFALVLRGTHDDKLRQGTYVIEHAELGSFSFLIVPMLSREHDARYYEININRLHG